MRPLVGVLSAGHGHFVLDGVPRMRERPIIDLVDGLKQVCTMKCLLMMMMMIFFNFDEIINYLLLIPMFFFHFFSKIIH
jgi:hypothetical protein